MRALVTGASGFCGRHLTRYLTEQQIQVFTLSCGGTKTSNHFRVADITDIETLTDVLRSIRPQYLFHLAGVTLADDPRLFYRVNTQYAVALLYALRCSGVHDCPVLLVGTSAEYGMISEKQLPIREDLPANPYNHYGISKLAQTFEGLAAHAMGRPAVVVRPFNIIGPGMPEHLVVQSFAGQVAGILKGKRVPVIEVGNLKSSRDFIDINDVVKIYWRIIQTSSAYGEVINVCSGRGVVIEDILSKLVELAGINIEVRPDPSRFKPVDVPEHYGSVERLHGLLGDISLTDLDTSLRRIIEDLAERS